MLKFFRNIRKKLLAENKFRKYLIYAVGEVVLIVIGIFLGLKLNTTHEAKLEDEVADSVLYEMILELNNDIINLDGRISYLQNDTRNREITLNSDNIEDISTDELYKTILGTNLDFKISTLSYQKYKNLNASELSNEISLNTEIFNYYNSEVSNFNLFRDWQSESYKKQTDFLLYNQSEIDLTGNSNFKLLSKSINQKERRKNMVYYIESTQGKNLIVASYYSEKMSLDIFKNFRNKTFNLLNVITEDLKSRKPELFETDTY